MFTHDGVCSCNIFKIADMGIELTWLRGRADTEASRIGSQRSNIVAIHGSCEIGMCLKIIFYTL